MSEESGEFICPKCGNRDLEFFRWMKKNNKWIFSQRGKWTNAEKQKSKKETLISLYDDIDSIQDQFMTLNATERNEECEPLYERIREVENDYTTYYKDSPKDLVWSTVEEWDNYRRIKERSYDRDYWYCYECEYQSPTFLDFVPKLNEKNNK